MLHAPQSLKSEISPSRYQQQSKISWAGLGKQTTELPDVEVSKTKLINVESGHLRFNHLDH